ncbi:MAG: glycosyltransferase family 2 protein [Candidatus Rokubacteria bacterium]|nr:glycosyltransferase family 2 protein [Candidatus Rokubacteria bacterium]
MTQQRTPVTVIILSYNEEINLPHALRSVLGWADQVFVVDSYSIDGTVEIARSLGATVVQHAWENWAAQRNWALATLPIRHDWVLFLDADERLTVELQEEITRTLRGLREEVSGFYIDRRMIFVGRWLKYGGYNPTWVLRLVRRDRVRVHHAGDREYFELAGKARYLRRHMLHLDQKDLGFWIDKHNRISNLAAGELLKGTDTQGGLLNQSRPGTAILERRRAVWLRRNVLAAVPSLLAPCIEFAYRYFFRLGFLDGRPGLIYCVLHAFWYPFLVKVKVEEMRRAGQQR